MGASIDLRRAHLTRQHGDLTVVLSYIDDERALFVIPTLRRGSPWFVVPESAAFAWDDEDHDTVASVAKRAYKACEVLGIEPTAQNCRRVAGIIIDTLPELITMPSAAERDRRNANIGEMHMRADGDVIASDLITTEDAGVEYAA